MSSAQRYAVGAFLLVLLAAHFLAAAFAPFVEGTVTDENGSVARAAVGWQGKRLRVTTDAAGRFRLPWVPASRRLIATKADYCIASVGSSQRTVALRLEHMPTEDNRDYRWIDPQPNPAEANNCANCHDEIYREWQGSAHAKSATNPKFLSLYAGSDGQAPVQKTWNARHEHPDGAAVCATCHVPTLTSPTLEYDVREAKGVAKSGIHCDYCHKIADAPTDKLGRRFGRDGLFLLRPANGEQLSYGPLDDAVRKGESFAHLPLYKESRYCASCHEGIVFGVHAYGTYSEWLESPAKAQGKQCQDCHMAPTGKMTNIAPKKGGVERDALTLASHHTPGGQIEMLQRALSMKVQTRETSRGRKVDIEIMAHNVGHRLPTGFPDRHLILVVTATDANGKHAYLVEGPRLPKNAGKWSGFAGSLFAKQLFDEKGRTPLPFWLPVDRGEDTRLFPDRAERRSFVFPQSAATVTAQLWYRRFWQEVADARGWTDNDLLVIENSSN